MGTELSKAVERESLNPDFPYMPKEEWDSRIKRVRGLIEKNGLDAVMVLNKQNSRYFFGTSKTYKNVYPAVGIIPHKGPTTIIMESGDALVVTWKAMQNGPLVTVGTLKLPHPQLLIP